MEPVRSEKPASEDDPLEGGVQKPNSIAGGSRFSFYVNKRSAFFFFFFLKHELSQVYGSGSLEEIKTRHKDER